MQRAPCPAGVWGGMYSRQSPRAGGAHPPGGAPTTHKGRSFVSALAAWPQDPSGRGAQTARGVSALEAGLSKQGGVTNDTRVLTENAQACARWAKLTEKGLSGPCTPSAVGEGGGFGSKTFRVSLVSLSSAQLDGEKGATRRGREAGTKHSPQDKREQGKIFASEARKEGPGA